MENYFKKLGWEGQLSGEQEDRKTWEAPNEENRPEAKWKLLIKDLRIFNAICHFNHL